MLSSGPRGYVLMKTLLTRVRLWPMEAMMTNDGHNGDNVEQGRGEPTLKEVCITPQPNRNASYTTCLCPKGCLWALLGSLGPYGVLLSLW